MARRKKSRRLRSRNSCCPLIHVKCSRKRGGALGDAGPGFLRTAEQVMSDRRAASALAHKKAIKVYCTVKVGATSRRVHFSKVRATVGKIIRNQHRKRCIPSLNGKLIIGARAEKFS